MRAGLIYAASKLELTTPLAPHTTFSLSFSDKNVNIGRSIQWKIKPDMINWAQGQELFISIDPE